MIEKIEMLPKGVFGISAGSKITQADYERVVVPILEEASQNQEKISFLYRITGSFESFTLGAAWEDFKISTRYLALFRKCGIVTDIKWIRDSAKFFGAMIPCQIRAYKQKDYDEAVDWLAKVGTDGSLDYKFHYDQSVLVLEPKKPLSSEDFEQISSVVDPWIKKHGELHGLVIHAKRFPGWENLGGAFEHVSFVRNHHKKIRKVAIAADGVVAGIGPQLSSFFINSEIKHFPYSDMPDAMSWARSHH